MKTKLTPLICIALILSLTVFVGGVVGAEENLTVFNPVNGTNSTEIEPLEDVDIAPPMYRNTEEYADNYAYWYDYHKSLLPTEEEQIQHIKSLLSDETQSNETKHNNVLSYIGLDEEFKTMSDESKRTIDDYTGVITWDLGVANWWGRIFGGGVYEDDLPQNIAEMNAITDIYYERYSLFTQAQWEMMFSDEN